MAFDGLEMQEISFTYRADRRSQGVAALEGVCWELPLGAIVGLVGPNGAGKTTLCKVVNGLLKPSGGNILWRGLPLEPYVKPGHLAAYAFQNPDDQLFAPTVRAELEFGPKNLRLSPSETARSVEEAANWLGVGDLLASHPLDLPFVLRKRVSIAAAIAMMRPLTILDEPTLGQDNNFKKRLQVALAALRSAGRTAVIVSHDPEFVFNACDRLLGIEGGRVQFSGRVEEYSAAPPDGWRGGPCSLSMRAGQGIPALRGVATFDQLRRRLVDLSGRASSDGDSETDPACPA